MHSRKNEESEVEAQTRFTSDVSDPILVRSNIRVLVPRTPDVGDQRAVRGSLNDWSFPASSQHRYWETSSNPRSEYPSGDALLMTASEIEVYPSAQLPDYLVVDVFQGRVPLLHLRNLLTVEGMIEGPFSSVLVVVFFRQFLVILRAQIKVLQKSSTFEFLR